MPGSGKSTIGLALAKKIGYPFIDLDSKIEYESKMFIEEIFYRYGESKFRSLETEALKQITDHHVVVACGGGIILDANNKPLMDGIIIYLDTDIDIIKDRLKDDYQRPLLKEKTLELLYLERNRKYQSFLDIRVKNDSSVSDTILEIEKLLKDKGIL